MTEPVLSLLPPAVWPLLLGLQVKATLILLGVTVIVAAAVRRTPAVRHGIWLVGVAGVLMLPLGWWLLPPVPVDAPRIAAVAASLQRLDMRAAGATVDGELASETSATAAVVSAAGERSGRAAAAPVARRPAAADEEGPFWPVVVMGVWASGALLRLTWVGAGMMQVRRLVRRGREDASCRALVTRLARELGIRRPVRLLCTETVDIPCTSGILAPVILLPPATRGWPRDVLTSVLLHELAHVRRRDALASLAAEGAVAIYWMNPLAWAARSRIRAEQERASDAVVLGTGIPAAEYARHLLEVARSCGAGRGGMVATALYGGEHGLKSRVRAILNSTPGAAGGARPEGLFFACCAAMVTILAIVAHPGAARSADPGLAARSDLWVQAVGSGGRASGDVRDGRIEIPTGPAAAGPADRLPGPDSSEAVADADADPAAGVAGYADSGLANNLFVWVQADRVRDADAALLSVHVDRPGVYRIWGLVAPHRRGGDDVLVTIDGAEAGRWDLPGRRSRGSRADADWYILGDADSGRGPLAVRLDAGTHGVRVAGRDAGERVAGLLVTDSETYVPRGAPPVTPPRNPVAVWLEAEAATVSGAFEVDHDREAAGHRFLRVEARRPSRGAPPKDGSAVLRFDVEEAGTYVLWARTRVRDDDEDSFWVRVNGGAWIEWNGIRRDRDWRWSMVRHEGRSDGTALFDLGRGAHTVEVAYRENGARLDRLLVTNDLTIRPRGREGSVSATTGGSTVAGGRAAIPD